MSGSARITTKAVVAGVTVDAVMVRQDELEISFQQQMPAGVAGVLTTRSGDGAGVITLPSGHGITGSNTVSGFWEGGSFRNGTILSADSTTITLDSVAGGVLPAQGTAIVICAEVDHTLAFTGDNMTVLAVSASGRAGVNFMDGATSDLHYVLAKDEGRLWIKDTGPGADNPLATDTITKVRLANGETTPTDVKIGILLSTD